MDRITNLLEELTRLGVRFGVEDGNLKIRASKGVVTKELQRRIAASKEEIVRRLQSEWSEDGGPGARLTPDPGSDHLPFPMSDLQLGFYIADDPHMEFHVRPHFYMEFDHGAFDVGAYEAAWNKALRRHRRELCRVNEALELQLLDETPTLECRVYDLRELPADAVEARLLAVRDEMKRQELPLDRWPWLDLRVSLWTEEGEPKARIHYNHNNFFSDGFGTNQLFEEIDAYYGEPGLTLPPLELSYRDAVLGLERLARSEEGEAARRYWFDRLPGLPPAPDLPQNSGLSRRCRSRLQGRVGTLERHRLEAIKTRARSLGLTPSNAIITAYAYVIATWSNSDRFILSQMVTRRFGELHSDLERMVGNFASLYPLEIELDPSATFVDNARRVQGRVLEDVRHLQIGGMRVLQELNRLTGSFGSVPSPFVIGSGLFTRNYKKPDFSVLETSQTILDHQFFETEDGDCHYVWDLLEEFFPEGLIDAMWTAYRGLLELLADEPEAWHRERFDLIGETDLRERRERNRTERPIPEACLHDALSEQAAARGDRSVLDGGRESLSYRELDRMSSSLALELAASGVGRNDLVPVIMDRDREVLVAVMAILKAGAAYVPIDPETPRERLSLLLEDLGASVLLTQDRHRASIEWPDTVSVLVVGGEPRQADAAKADGGVSPGPRPSDLAYVIYTSGSTGAPKGVMIDHRGALNTILDVNERFGIGPADTIFGVSAFNFDLSVYDIFGTVAAGATLVYPEPGSALDPTHWLELLIQREVTVWNSVPALMSLLVETARRRRVELPSLRLVFLSGDKIPLDLPDAIRRVAPNARVISLGGATEASIWSIVYPIDRVDSDWQTIPYGYPMVNQTWHVRDANGRPCPTWVPGELYIGGVGVAKGYWRDADKTRRAFPTDPLTGERLYRTGDRGRYLPGGCIEWMGRVDFQVKIQGMRIEPGEIEAALGEHPRVQRAVVVVHEPPGGQPPRLVAHVVPAADVQAGAEELEAFLEERLPAHMVPRSWRRADHLPLTSNGKVDRKALAEQGDEEPRAARPRPEYVAPRNDTEAKLQEMWSRILQVSRVGATDDFFELGGQSFDAIRIFALIKDEFGKAYTLSDMWAARTIRGLAERIDGAGAAPAGRRVVPIDLGGEGRPLFLVHPAGGSIMAYSRLGRLLGRPLYGIQARADGADAHLRRDIGELAKSYVAEVRQVQSDGPYSLGGWSSGALIAFEMAAQLERAGEAVSGVFLLDGPAPFDHGEIRDDRLVRWFLQDLALGLPVERLNGARLQDLPLREQLRRAVALMEADDRRELDVEQLLPNFQIFRDLIVAGDRYSPPTIAADLTVVRVEEDIVDEFASHPSRDAEDWGWSAFTQGEVRCTRVPGAHHSFLAEPSVGSWSSLLEEET